MRKSVAPKVNLKDLNLPKDVTKEFDVDGDGEVDVAELIAHVQKHQNLQKSHNFLTKVLLLTLVVMILFFGSLFGRQRFGDSTYKRDDSLRWSSHCDGDLWGWPGRNIYWWWVQNSLILGKMNCMVGSSGQMNFNHYRGQGDMFRACAKSSKSFFEKVSFVIIATIWCTMMYDDHWGHHVFASTLV